MLPSSHPALLAVALATMSPALACGAPADPPAAIAAAPSPGLRETDGAAPEDLEAFVVPNPATGGVYLRLRRPGYLVALRGAGGTAAGGDEALLDVPRAEADGAPILWETTQVDTLETTRGVLRVDGERARLHLADAPVPVAGGEARLHHACRAQEDGLGGLTVLCRITRFATATSLSETVARDTWIAASPERSVVRMDFAVCPGTVDARVIQYADDLDRVVVRVEASFLPGEAGPALSVLSAERRQPPVVPRFHHPHPRHFDPF